MYIFDKIRDLIDEIKPKSQWDTYWFKSEQLKAQKYDEVYGCEDVMSLPSETIIWLKKNMRKR